MIINVLVFFIIKFSHHVEDNSMNDQRYKRSQYNFSFYILLCQGLLDSDHWPNYLGFVDAKTIKPPQSNQIKYLISATVSNSASFNYLLQTKSLKGAITKKSSGFI